MKKIFSISIFCFTLISNVWSQIPNYVPSNGLVGWWPFNGNANDLSGNGNNGAVSGGTLTANRFGISNSAYLFDNSMTSTLSLPFTNVENNFSISIWAKATRNAGSASSSNLCPGTTSVPLANSNQNWLLRPGQPSGKLGVGISFGTDRIMIAEHAPNLLVTRLNSIATRVDFIHIVLTYTTTGMKLYVNGQLAGSKTMHCTSIAKVLSTTFAQAMYSPEFSGIIDDIGIWNRELTDQEIQSLYSSPFVSATISANGPTTICAGETVLLTSAVAPSGVYQYQWQRNGTNISGANTSSLSVNTSGNYVLRVTDLNSNVYNSNAINVTVNSLPPAPNVTYISPAIICDGESIGMSDNSSTNVSFLWFLNNATIPSSTSNSYNATIAGTYKLQVTNLTTGCKNFSQNIVVGEMPNIVQNEIVSCGSSTTISLTNPNFSYSTLPASCSVDMSNSDIVSNNVGNSGSGGQKKIICFGGNFTNSGGGSNYYVVEYGGTLNWSNAGSSNFVYVKAGGIFNVSNTNWGLNTVYYETGAILNITTSSQINTINCNKIGVIYPSNSTAMCNNLTYQWSNGATTPSITVNPSVATTYSVTVSNGSLSCTDQVLVTPSVATPLISTSGPTTFCQGGSVVLTSSSATGNTWSNGATTQSITVSSNGNYSVTVSNGGCSVTSSPTIVTVNPSPATPSITASGATTFCQGDSVTLNSSSVTNNIWSNGETSQSIVVTDNGTYSVSVSNGNCIATSIPTVVNVNPIPSVSLTSLGSFTNINSSTISLNGSPSGGVYSGNGVNGIDFDPQIAGLGSTTINYSYTNSFGCSGLASQSTIVYDTTGIVCSSYDTVTIYDTLYTTVTDTLIINTTLNLPAPNNENTIRIYPNPASNFIFIDNGNYAAMNGYTIKIQNNAGQEVFQSAINQQLFTIDLSTWTGDGLYFVHLIDAQGNTVTVRKIVLQ